MAVKCQVFTVPLWTSEPYYCPPVEKSFTVTGVSRIRWAKVIIDVNPIMPAWPDYAGCITGDKIYINGHPIKYTGDPCDIIEASIPVEYLREGINKISFDIQYYPGVCAVFSQGTVSGSLQYEACIEEGEEPPVKPPEETEQPCKLFGIFDIGKMKPSQCTMINTAMSIGILLFGAVLLIKLLK